jgi:hypothetical protein
VQRQGAGHQVRAGAEQHADGLHLVGALHRVDSVLQQRRAVELGELLGAAEAPRLARRQHEAADRAHGDSGPSITATSALITLLLGGTRGGGTVARRNLGRVPRPRKRPTAARVAPPLRRARRGARRAGNPRAPAWRALPRTDPLEGRRPSRGRGASTLHR